MKLNSLIAPVIAAAFCCVVHADIFEGKVSMTITQAANKGGPQTVNFSLKDGYMRIDASTAQGSVAMITDFKASQVTIIMPAQKIFMVQPINLPSGAAPQGGAASSGTLTQTGETDTILGYTCTKYTETGPDGTAEIWVTDQLGSFGGLFHGGPGGRGQPPAGWESALKGKNLFPMRVVANQTGKGTSKIEVTKVEKGTLPDSTFQVPSDYHNPSAFMGGMPGGFPGQR